MYKRTIKWWNRERVIAGLKRFYADFGCCPPSSDKYGALAQFNGVDPATGKHSNLGWHQKYPSWSTVRNHFASFRQAWVAAGFADEVDRSFEEWSADEDWFILESVGILPRSEVAAYIKRTGPAIKRRIYDLGDIRHNNRWGIAVSRAEQLLGISQTTIRKYLDCGIIPYLRGNKLLFLNPADLLKVEEVDWSKPVKPELDAMIRAAIAQRIAKMAKYGSSWRDHEVYKFHIVKERFTGRVKSRKSAFAKDWPEPPNDLAVGDWISATKPLKHMLTGAGNRVGLIKALHYSPTGNKRIDGTQRACWVARVEWPKIRTITNETDRRIRWTVPLDCLIRAEPPEIEAKVLMMTPRAVRGRKNLAARSERLHRHFNETIQPELT